MVAALLEQGGKMMKQGRIFNAELIKFYDDYPPFLCDLMLFIHECGEAVPETMTAVNDAMLGLNLPTPFIARYVFDNGCLCIS